MKYIVEFRGPYFFLANFYPTEVEVDSLCYSSSEAAYQAQKAPVERRAEFRLMTPSEAKKAGAAFETDDWKVRRLSEMQRVVLAKFARDRELTRMLLATGDVVLIEGNKHGDAFWGCVWDGHELRGENMLGQILMAVRTTLREAQPKVLAR